MDTMLLRMFQRQVALQCTYLLASASELDAALRRENIEQTFYALQNFLNAGANISKALWGAGGKHSIERKVLRESVGIDDASPLREVTMRNNFEHFDERLDRWWEESKAHNYMDLLIGPKNMITGQADTDKFRHFDPKTGDMVFWGQEFNIKKLLDEVRKLRPKLEAEAAKPHWEPKPRNPKS